MLCYLKKGSSPASFALTTLVLTLLLSVFTVSPAPAQAAKKVTVNGAAFYSQQFLNTWLHTDLPVATEEASRSWYWGIQPLGPGIMENYADAPGGKRLVQYFDKARMEINNPLTGQVTNGLLVVEMITGKLQSGDKSFEQRNSAKIPVAGDLDNSFPTYADLNTIYNKSQNTKVGDTVTQLFQSNGTFGTQSSYTSDANTNIVDIENNFGIPTAFWNYMNLQGQVFQLGTTTTDTVSDWHFSLGLPITEAFWTKVKVAGVMKDVLVQAFERRILTYTPSNDPAFQVEMGNVGLAYVQWRYNGQLPAPAPLPSSTPFVPTPQDALTLLFTGPHPQWYSSNTVLNIRTAPNSEATLPNNSATEPYLQRLQPGDHILVTNMVHGEAVIPGNDIWYQIYQSPDLFVYSGYTQPVTLPDFPTPTQTFSGLWVAISLDKQMMAIYKDSTLLYKTFIASGRGPRFEGDQDHSTPKGVFQINGSFRPKVQEMVGGAGDAATGGDHYDIKDIRNVNYFYQDYSIHGTYWHAKFGIAPQSHGCANATVYDASLVYQMPAGTTVEVF